MTPPPRSRRRTARTLFVHRWHAAQTIGEWLGNDSVGERFEHINHVRSLAQYVWRYGAFREEDDGTGRVAVSRPSPRPPTVTQPALSLNTIVKPLAARGREHFELAVRYAARFGDEHPADRQSGDPTLADLLSYASRNRDIVTFARQLVQLHRVMLRYYVQMRYLTPREADAFQRGQVPVLTPLRSSTATPPK